jgi:hypothetical protein
MYEVNAQIEAAFRETGLLFGVTNYYQLVCHVSGQKQRDFRENSANNNTQ